MVCLHKTVYDILFNKSFKYRAFWRINHKKNINMCKRLDIVPGQLNTCAPERNCVLYDYRVCSVADGAI